jgi:hypothetical protein
VLVVRLLKNKGTDAELRLEWVEPGKTNWVHDARNTDFFSAKSSQGGGNALVVIRNPDPGYWSFRGYYVDYETEGDAPREATRQNTKISVHYKVYGNFKPKKNLEPQDLNRPSSVTARELRVYVPAIGRGAAVNSP